MSVADWVFVALLAVLAALSLWTLFSLRALKAAKADQPLWEEVLRLSDRQGTGFEALRRAALEQQEALRREVRENREDLAKALSQSLGKFEESLHRSSEAQAKQQQDLRRTLDEKLRDLQSGNEKKLDEMRKTVDEHLQTALERRITESFKTVAERLEAVQKGLGEMQSLAVGVGDLKRVLTNVKSRGTFGEVQLEALIADMLTPDQYVANYDCGKLSGEHVEFGIRLPGTEVPVHLPVDAKFPVEDYERLLQAAEMGDKAMAERAALELERSVTKFAKDVSGKYINVPHTTDWAILFLPTEGLYAEVLRRPGLFERLQRDLRVVIAGPTNLQVMLSTFRMGHKQVAMSQQAHGVMQTLAAVRSEFDKYGSQIDAMVKSFDAARNHIDRLSTRRNMMLRALKNVETLDEGTANQLLGGNEADE